MLRRVTLSLGALTREERGTSVVELALLFPLLLIFIAGMIDLGNGLAMRIALHRAVNTSIEMASAYSFETDADIRSIDFDALIPIVAKEATVDEEDVDVETWLECDGVEQPEFDSTCPPGEPIARYLQIRAEKTFTPMFDFGVVGKNGSIPLFAEEAVRIQ